MKQASGQLVHRWTGRQAGRELVHRWTGRQAGRELVHRWTGRLAGSWFTDGQAEGRSGRLVPKTGITLCRKFRKWTRQKTN
jgi:hypothetical protein